MKVKNVSGYGGMFRYGYSETNKTGIIHFVQIHAIVKSNIIHEALEIFLSSQEKQRIMASFKDEFGGLKRRTSIDLELSRCKAYKYLIR